MRFEPGWLDAVEREVAGHPHTIFCANCVGLLPDNDRMDNPNPPAGNYFGATMCFMSDTEVLEGKWAPERPGEDGYELPCLMGASYVVPRKWFFHIGGLAANKMWGSEEPWLSLRTWLAGGSIRMMKKVRIGHLFRPDGQAPYVTSVYWLIYNKIRTIMSTMNTAEAEKLIKLLGRFSNDDDYRAALMAISEDREEINADRARMNQIYVHDVKWFCEKFNTPYFV
jgi:hypothetical protein